ncbi:MAG: tape measure protein [Pseudomonadota bacterium]|nr:tape measure protein [Pseudomonadota bacterium]
MTVEIERLLVTISADTRALRKNLDRAALEANRAAKQLERGFAEAGEKMRMTFNRVAAAASAVAGIIGAGALGSALIDTNKEFQQLEATLGVFLKSTDKAAQAFEIIREFAKQTPFSVRDISAAFTRMVGVGIEPSISALQAFGDVVAATPNKSLIDFIEAVADASVGEFERLKEFNIKAAKEGESVKLTFNGLTREVENSSEAIVDALIAISRENFSGAASAQMNTLTGAFSNLGDAADDFLAKVGGAGLNDAIANVARVLSSLTESTSGAASSIGRFLASGVNAIPGIMENIARAAMFVSDNFRFLIGLTAGFVSIRIVETLISTARAFILYSKAINLARLSSLAFTAVQKVGKLGLVTMAGVIALAIGQLDEFRAAIDEVINLFRPEFDEAISATMDLLEGLGLDFTALETEIKSFTPEINVASRSIQELDTDLKKIIGTTGQVATTTAGTKTELQRLAEDGVGTLEEAADKAIVGGLRGMEDALASVADGSRTTGEAFRDMVRSMLSEIARLSAKQLTGGLGDLLAKLLDPILTSSSVLPFTNTPSPSVPAAFGFSAFADGGRPPVGVPSLVGERGPELFVPDVAGRIIPNDALGRGGGSVMNVVINAEGADPAGLRRVEAALIDLNQNFSRRAIDAVGNDIARGGGLARLVRA